MLPEQPGEPFDIAGLQCDTVVTVDELDRRLLIELAKDARQTSLELSQKLASGETTIRRRIRRLIEHNIIRVIGIPDPAKLGYTMAALIALEVELPSVDEVVESLSTYPNVQHVITCTGGHDIICWVQFRSPAEMEEFIKKRLARIPGIRKSETHTILNVKSNIVTG